MRYQVAGGARLRQPSLRFLRSEAEPLWPAFRFESESGKPTCPPRRRNGHVAQCREVAARGGRQSRDPCRARDSCWCGGAMMWADAGGERFTNRTEAAALPTRARHPWLSARPPASLSRQDSCLAVRAESRAPVVLSPPTPRAGFALAFAACTQTWLRKPPSSPRRQPGPRQACDRVVRPNGGPGVRPPARSPGAPRPAAPTAARSSPEICSPRAHPGGTRRVVDPMARLGSSEAIAGSAAAAEEGKMAPSTRIRLRAMQRQGRWKAGVANSTSGL